MKKSFPYQWLSTFDAEARGNLEWAIFIMFILFDERLFYIEYFLYTFARLLLILSSCHSKESFSHVNFSLLKKKKSDTHMHASLN